MMRPVMRPGHIGFVFAFASLLGCGSSSPRVCSEGLTRACPCEGGVEGIQTCTGGSFDACRCAEPPAVCGDGRCGGGETCLSCREDCGACPTCGAAPSCTEAAGVPTTTMPRADLDVGTDAASSGDGAMPTPPNDVNCREPQLRLRVEKVSVHKGGGQIYCIISGTDGAASEVALTTKTKDLDDDEAHFFDPSVAVFWGLKSLAKTSGNLTVTYDCFKVGSDSWAKALEAMGEASAKAGGYAGPYGWAFGAGAVAAAAAASAAQAASGDEHRLNVQQTIDRAALLDLTNGRTWQVRQTGDCGVFCDWDWTLTIQAWGCADVYPGPTG